ncbi:hypothetical protein DV735_g5525, partial [Chaetothyriales sp. CBS 134920]
MFYSEKLLSTKGPLGRVWQAANVERKLSKSQVLQSDIQKNVDDIGNTGEAPMALRLSGQLMLGVVRIYGKKAKYLQDDCHEALLKIRMTFKNSGSHDLPANAHVGIDLNLPEVLTIDDLFPSMDFDYPMTQPAAIEAASQDPDYDQDWTSTLNPHQSTQSVLSPEDDQPVLNDDDLGLDFGDDLGANETTVSVQIGRDAAPERTLADEVGGGEKVFDEDDDLNLDLGEDIGIDTAPGPVQPVEDVEMQMQVEEDLVEDAPVLGDDETLLLRQQAAAEDQREASVLSEPGSELMRDLDQTFQQAAEEEVSELAVKQRQQRRKFKPVVPDVETVLRNRQIKQQAEDRSKILKAPVFLPRDPFLLTLIEMQKNGDFVTQAMNDGRSRDWAPELQGLLSFEVVHRPNKRKRDSGIGGLSEDEHSEKSPRLDVLEDDIDIDIDVGAGGQTDGAFAVTADDTIQPIHSDQPVLDDEEIGHGDEGEVEASLFPAGDDEFNETTVPILHPADSGPVSLSTKRAVHLLCETFGGAPPDGTPSSQAKKSVLLQDIIPEKTTSREDATKMFFEVLVLATKDAIKVEQGDKHIGLPLRIRAKRGLWGDWAATTPAEEEGGAQAATA